MVAMCSWLSVEAVKIAEQMDDGHLLSGALLAFAEAALIHGDAQEALTAASRAQINFALTGQQDSEWRAWLITARASKLLGDETKAHENASRANDALLNLQQKWGAEAYRSYLARPDMTRLQRQLIKEIPVV